MTCWRCGRVAHAAWCSDGTPNDCTHCGGNPCRWWCEGADEDRGIGFQPGNYFGRVRERVGSPA